MVRSTLNNAFGVIVCCLVVLTMDSSCFAEDKDSPSVQARLNSIENRIQRAEIRLQIRQQDVVIAKAEAEAQGATLTQPVQALETARNNLQLAEIALARIQMVVEQGIASQDQLNGAQARLNSAKAMVLAHESQIVERKKLINVHNARVRSLELKAELAALKLRQLQALVKPAE